MSDLEVIVKLNDLGNKAKEARAHVRFTEFVYDKKGEKTAKFNIYPRPHNDHSVKYIFGVYTSPKGNEIMLLSIDKMLKRNDYRDLYYNGGDKDYITLSYKDAKGYAEKSVGDKFAYFIGIAKKCKSIKNLNGLIGFKQRLKDDKKITRCLDGCYLVAK